MIAEAVAVAKEKYDIDFSIFDTDGDGLVDNVYCLYAGYGQADSPVSDSIWPHSYNMSSVNSEFEVDGVTVDRYTVSQQLNGITGLPVGIGTLSMSSATCSDLPIITTTPCRWVVPTIM